MKILLQGHVAIKWIGRCNRCTSVIEADERELSDIQMGDYRNDYEAFAWDDCPRCLKAISLPGTVLFVREDSVSGKALLSEVILLTDAQKLPSKNA